MATVNVTPYLLRGCKRSSTFYAAEGTAYVSPFHVEELHQHLVHNPVLDVNNRNVAPFLFSKQLERPARVSLPCTVAQPPLQVKQVLSQYFRGVPNSIASSRSPLLPEVARSHALYNSLYDVRA